MAALVTAAHRARSALDDLITDSPDPGAEAICARHELAQTLTPFGGTTEPDPWQRALDGLNTLVDADIAFGIDLDGTITDHDERSIVWDGGIGRWVLHPYEDDADQAPAADGPVLDPCDCPPTDKQPCGHCHHDRCFDCQHCPCACRCDDVQPDAEPLPIRWDRTVIPAEGDDDTIVCCIATDGSQRPVALFLDDELREALGDTLLADFDGDDEPDAEQGGDRG